MPIWIPLIVTPKTQECPWASIEASLIQISTSGLNVFLNACRIQEAFQGSKRECRILWQLCDQYRWSDSRIWSQCFWPAGTQHQGRWLDRSLTSLMEVNVDLTSLLHSGWHTRHDQALTQTFHKTHMFVKFSNIKERSQWMRQIVTNAFWALQLFGSLSLCAVSHMIRSVHWQSQYTFIL